MSDISVRIEDHIATVTLDRPPVNAVDTDTFHEIRDAFRSLDDDRDVRVAVFTAAGTRAFMGGADLKTINKRRESTKATEIIDPPGIARAAMWAITDCAVPVIGAINGPALGAGLAFAACCDVLFAADHATFGTTEINVGLLGASAHLMLLVGRHKAREMYFSGERVPAQELYRLGAVRTVVPADGLMAEAYEFARLLAGKSPIAMRLAKDAMNRIEHLPLKEAYRTEQDYTARLLRFEDAKEANRAFLDKRDPEWKWR